MITAALAFLGISLPSLVGGGSLGIILEIIGLIGKGKKIAGVVGSLAGPTEGTLAAPKGTPVDLAKAPAPATPQAKPLPPVAAA